MERLTTNKPVSEMGMLELAHNSCYVKDGNARYRDFEMDMDARELTRLLLKDHAQDDDAFESDEDFDEWMIDYLQNGIDTKEGLIALFYRNLWAMAELREQLKAYEDAEEQGLLWQNSIPNQRRSRAEVGRDERGMSMSKLNQVICDVCNKPIESGSILFHQYKVKISSVELATDFCKKRKLDMCPNCMKEFKNFVATKELFKEV